MSADDDPFSWLEEVDGDAALDWVRRENARSLAELEADARYAALYREALAVLTATDRIPYPRFLGDRLANFWQDEGHVRGLWRTTSLASFRTDDPDWQTVLDIDALAAAEGKNWVYQGASVLPPDDRRALVSLSDGGRDAHEVREFDIAERRFVAGGFDLPEGKQSATWLDADTLLVGRDWGPGTLTASGYPYILKRWRRGTPLDASPEVFRGEATDVSVRPAVLRDPEGRVRGTLVFRALTFFETEAWLLGDAAPIRLPLPLKSQFRDFVSGQLVFTLEEDWRHGGAVFTAGTMVSLDLAACAADAGSVVPSVVYAPGPREMIEQVTATRSVLLATIYRNVEGSAAAFCFEDGAWQRRDLTLPQHASVSLIAADEHSERVFLDVAGYLQPNALYLADLAADTVAAVKSLPPRFDAAGATVEAFEATSQDGTRVPYFVVRPAPIHRSPAMPRRSHLSALPLDGGGLGGGDFARVYEAAASPPPPPSPIKGEGADGAETTAMPAGGGGLDGGDGATPTLLYGYGGFQVSLTPAYYGVVGKLWIEKGGAYVVANIRGGGEFGPAWHQAALKECRTRAFDDFVAVAEDLIRRGITSPRRLGIMGGSNGGLLMGAVLTRRPELFRAVVIQVPLLDMLRYHKLLAGASWMAEYGDPDVPAEAAFLRTISPYHNLRPGLDYPEPFFVTSTKDDRVHPGHARKMAAKMAAMHLPFLYYENIDGGHSAAANLAERARRQALEFTYLAKKLMD